MILIKNKKTDLAYFFEVYKNKLKDKNFLLNLSFTNNIKINYATYLFFKIICKKVINL